MDSTQIHSKTDPLVKAKILKREQKNKSPIVHYTYERRFAHYKAKVHQTWRAFFPPSTGIHTKLIVGTRNQANLTNELVRRSPRRKKEKKKHNNQFDKHIDKEQIY